MEFRYGLEDRPPLGESLLMGLQWCALMLPFLIILGKIAAAYHLADPAQQTAYLQKMAFIIAIFLVLEILWGHRLPLIMGPSSVILIGIISSHGLESGCDIYGRNLRRSDPGDSGHDGCFRASPATVHTPCCCSSALADCLYADADDPHACV